jgi:hypothetical protein
MVDHISKFDKHFAFQGGWYNYPASPNGGMFEFLLKEWIQRMENYQDIEPRFPPANTNFINNYLLNAVASKSGNEYYIGVYAGAFYLINELFLRMMASPNVLPDIGDVTKEKPTQKIYNPQLIDFADLMVAKPEPDPEHILPVDPTRQLYASLFAKAALYFLFDHEYAHVIFGHVDFIGQASSVFSIEEAQLKISTIPAIDFQTLEMDADSFATHHGILFVKTAIDHIDQLPAHRRPFFSGWENGISNWLFSIYALFRLFGYREYKASDLLTHSHPPVGIRQRMIYHTLRRLCEERLETGITSRINTIYLDTIDKVEQAFNEISEIPLTRSAIDFAYTPEASNHIFAIVENWKKVRPELEKYARGYLSPA